MSIAAKKAGRPARLGDRLNEAFDELERALAGDGPLDAQFTVRTASKPPEPGRYGAKEIKRVRARLGVSQTVFGWVMGASPALVRAWERGTRVPSAMARRLLDEINGNADAWRRKLLAAAPASARHRRSA